VRDEWSLEDFLDAEMLLSAEGKGNRKKQKTAQATARNARR
jgi:hypothetical protein